MQIFFSLLYVMILGCSLEQLHANPKEATVELATRLREEARPLEAVDIYNKSIASMLSFGRRDHLAEALVGKMISWNHLAEKTGERIYLLLALNEVELLTKVDQAYDLHTPAYLMHYLKGKALQLLEEYPISMVEFGNAASLLPESDLQKGDWIIHHGNSMMLAGKIEEGKQRIFEGLRRLKMDQERIDSFQYNVWLSGAYIKLARALADHDREEAKLYYFFAQDVVEKDPRLIVRTQQLEKLWDKLLKKWE